METFFFKLVVPIAVALVMALAGTGGASAQACIDSSAEQQALIDEGRIISQYEALEQTASSDDQLLDYRLCEQNGRYVWTLSVLSADGTAQNLTVSAE